MNNATMIACSTLLCLAAAVPALAQAQGPMEYDINYRMPVASKDRTTLNVPIDLKDGNKALLYCGVVRKGDTVSFDPSTVILNPGTKESYTSPQDNVFVIEGRAYHVYHPPSAAAYMRVVVTASNDDQTRVRACKVDPKTGGLSGCDGDMRGEEAEAAVGETGKTLQIEGKALTAACSKVIPLALAANPALSKEIAEKGEPSAEQARQNARTLVKSITATFWRSILGK